MTNGRVAGRKLSDRTTCYALDKEAISGGICQPLARGRDNAEGIAIAHRSILMSYGNLMSCGNVFQPPYVLGC
jgi:hypothetical protein